MKSRKKTVYLMTGILVLAMILAELVMMKQEGLSFSVEVTTGDGTETVKPWYDDGCYYVFLPSYADPDQAKVVTSFLTPLWIQGERVGSETVCGAFPFNEKLDIRYHVLGETREEKVYVCQSGNVPTLYIDTASGSMDYIHEEKGNAESGKLRLYTPEGVLASNAQIQTIYGRGNSTWWMPKRPYSLELTQSADLLGMGSAKKWILLANYLDSTNMGNKMTYDFAAAVGCAYTPECQWIDLYLNGEYAGLYVISERNEVDPQRVDIPKENSFLISKTVEWHTTDRNYTTFVSDSGAFMRIQHSGIPEERVQEIWNRVENAIYAPDGVDPISGKHWQDLIDLDSWAQQFLLWEVFAEYDAATISKFFYYDDDSDKVLAGPIWDMDRVLNQHQWYTPNILAGSRKYIWNREQVNLFYALYQKEPFHQRVKELYWQAYRPLLVELAENGMQTYLAQSLAAGEMNSVRWESGNPKNAVQEGIEFLKARIVFLDDYWQSEEGYYTIELKCENDGQWRSFAVHQGEQADFLPTDCQWLEYETGERFDISAPVTRDWVIQQVENEEE